MIWIMYFQRSEHEAGQLEPVPPVDESIRLVNDIERAAGLTLEGAAHALSLVRAVGSLALAHEINSAPEYQSWKQVLKFGLLAATDGEGYLARAGRWLQKKDESKKRELNSYVDQIPDKMLVNCTLGAIAKREHQNDNHLYAHAIESALGIIVARDVIVTADRLVATAQGIDTRAEKAGKLKAFELYIITGLALSPLANNTIGKTVVALGLHHAAGESIKSGVSLHKSLNKKRHEKKQQPMHLVEQKDLAEAA